MCKIHVDYMDQTGTACLIIFVFNSIKSTHRMDQCVSLITVCTVFRPSIYYIKEVYIYIYLIMYRLVPLPFFGGIQVMTLV